MTGGNSGLGLKSATRLTKASAVVAAWTRSAQ